MSVPSGKLLGDGKDVYCVSGNAVGLIQTNSAGGASLRRIAALGRAFKNVAVAPASTRQRFAAHGKFFALDAAERKVYAWGADGRALGAVLDLSAVKVAAGFESVAVMPGSGYLLVGTGYPDSTVYRFDADGEQARGGVWPWGGWNAHLQLAGGHVWGLQSKALRYDDFLEDAVQPVIGDGRDMYANGIASDSLGGYYLSTSQGLKHYPADAPSRCDRRIGGCGAPLALALSHGQVIVSLGNQLLAMNLDDEPTDALGNAGNEPWHVGGNWDSCGCAIVPDGRSFLILDSKRRTLWRFSPQVESWLDRANRIVDLKKPFAAPSDLAFACETLVFCRRLANSACPGDVTEPLTRVDAFGGDELAVAGTRAVWMLRGGTTVWRAEMPVRDIAVIGGYLAVSGDDLRLLDKQGNTVFRAPYALGALAASGKWLIGADPTGARILRFRLK